MMSTTGAVSPLFPDTDKHYTEFSADLSRSRTLDQFSRRIHKTVKTLGFSDYVFMRLERVWQGGSQQGLLSSLPPMWWQQYQSDRLYKSDLMIAYGKANTHPIFSSHLYEYIDAAPFELALTINNRQVHQLYKQMNYWEHYIVPMEAFNGDGHVLLVLTSVGMDKQAFQARVSSLADVCHGLCKAIDAVSTLRFRLAFVGRTGGSVVITDRPLLIMRCMANDDSTITELADKLCISATTAHQHVTAARKAMGTKTNIRAILKAVKLGLIQVN